jgi:hypothetical protein
VSATDALDTVARRVVEWKRDPVKFVRDVFRVEPDPWQIPVLRAFPSQEPGKLRIAMQSAAGVGKGAVMAWCAWNFLVCYGEDGHHPNAAALSVTKENLQINFAKELAAWRNRSTDGLLEQMFESTSDMIYARGHKETWFLSFRSYPKDADTETLGRTLSGLHARWVAFFIDESGTIPVEIMRAAEQAASGADWFKVMQAGNPLSDQGMLYVAATRQRDRWMHVVITADPDDPNRSPRIPVELARSQIEANGGRDNPWVMVYILGQFPKTAFNALLGVAQVEEAMQRNPRPDHYDFAAKILGVDVAREGLDRSCIFPRQGLASMTPTVLRLQDGVQGAGIACAKWRDWEADACFVDNTGGFGGSWIDQMRVLNYSPTPVEFSGSATDPRYANKRSEMIFLCAEWVKAGGALPPMPDLVAELTEPRYFHRGDKLAIEPKDDIRKRLGRSPDLGDALALTFAYPVAPKAKAEDALAPWFRQPVVTEYDPYK